jgi:hypothetical protein
MVRTLRRGTFEELLRNVELGNDPFPCPTGSVPDSWASRSAASCCGVQSLPSPQQEAGLVPVDQHDSRVSDHPGVVTFGEKRNVAGAKLELRSVRHQNVKMARKLILKVLGLAPFRAGDPPDVLRPAPAGLERETSDHFTGHLEEIHSRVRKRSGFVRVIEVAPFRNRHDVSGRSRLVRYGHAVIATRGCAAQPLGRNSEGPVPSIYSVVLPSKCSLSDSASVRVWWTTPSR